MTSASLQLFGRRTAPHTIIVARGESVRHFTVRPWLARTAAVGAMLAAACFVGGGLLLAFPDAPTRFSPETTGAAAASYELRIATLRSEVDRLTTRGFIDRQVVSSKVDLLLDQQAALSERYSRMQAVLDRARENGILRAAIPVPVQKPAADDAPDGIPPLAFAGSNDDGPPAMDRFDAMMRGGARDEGMPELIRKIGQSIDAAELVQAEGLGALAARARAKSASIGAVLRAEGIGNLVLPQGDVAGEGGPFLPATSENGIDAGIADLAGALDMLQSVRETSAALPLATPVGSSRISSTFGVRSDPFLGRAAMHTGIDFVAENGAGVKASGPGKVVFAGDNGAYGRMVEIEHTNGLTTRYAHLSEITVAVGDTVNAGAPIGRVGSTGRSTGPHLHYELRRAGNAIDPARFLRAGRKLDALG